MHTPDPTTPLGPPRAWPYSLAFYGLPHTSRAFRATWTGESATTAGAMCGSVSTKRAQAEWMRANDRGWRW